MKQNPKIYDLAEKHAKRHAEQLTYPTIKEQKQFWIDKEAQSDNATNETRDALIEALQQKLQKAKEWNQVAELELRNSRSLYSELIDDFTSISNQLKFLTEQRDKLLEACKRSMREIENCGDHDLVQFVISAISDASNLSKSDSTTADPKPEDIGGNELPDRIEANEDWYDLRDDGRSDGHGESYAERNT